MGHLGMGCDGAIGFQPPDDDVTVCICATPHLPQQAKMYHQPQSRRLVSWMMEWNGAIRCCGARPAHCRLPIVVASPLKNFRSCMPAT